MQEPNSDVPRIQADWQATVNHLVATLDKFKVPQAEKDEVLAAISSFKKDIVEK